MKIENRILNGFLLKHRIKGKFLANIKDRFPFIRLEHSSDVLTCYFSWIDTNEGYYFWCKYHKQYRTYHAKYYKGGTK